MRFPPDFVDKVREANNIVDVIAPYTQLRSAGSNFMGRCPFPDHNDKTASFSVSEDKQLYNCFGCKKSGNVFTFLKDFNGYSFPEAVEFLARRANIALPERDEDPREKRQRELRESVLTANRLAASYFEESFRKLPESNPVRVYAEKRGLTPEIIETFKIGYSPEDWQGLVKAMRARRIPLEVGEKAGLVKKSTRTGGDSHFDLFRGRLMFPILAASGDVLGFGGRVLANEEPKYLNSPETPVFHKGRVLYGLDVTARYIRSQDEAVIVEGYMDAVALYGAGIKNVAAILGTAFTPDHGRVIRRMTPNVLMLLDGDRAGIQGAERSLPALLAAEIRPRGLILPEGQDPDDFLKEHGVEALRGQMASAGDLFTLLLTRHWMADYRATAADRMAVVERAGAALAPAGPGLLQSPMAELFMSEMARYLDVEVAWVRKTLSAKISAMQNRAGSYGEKPSEKSYGPATSGPSATISEGNVAPAAGNLSSAGGKDPRREQQIDLSGISREESAALGLLLQSRFLMSDLSEASKEWFSSGAAREEHPIAYIFDDEGSRKLIGNALRRYGQQPEGFATLAASLMENVAQPEILQKSLAEAALLLAISQTDSSASSASEESAEKHRRQMAKILNAIQRRRKQAELNRVSLELREVRGGASGERSQELMERYMTIQRELKEIENERRMFERGD